MSGLRLKRYLIEALRLLRQRRFRVLFDKGRRLSGMTASRVSAMELASACADLNALVCVVDSAQFQFHHLFLLLLLKQIL